MNEFDQKAQTWDAKAVRVERAQATAERIRAAVPLNPRMTALEYGCGTGLVSFALQPYLGHITLADSSIGMLTVLQEKIAAGGIQNTGAAHAQRASAGTARRARRDRLRHSAGLTPLQLDLLCDPLPHDQYQLIYTLLTLHHIADTDKVLRAFYVLLDHPGYLCVADLDKEDGTFHEEEFHGHLGFDRDELGAQVRQAGFQSIHFTTVFHMSKDVQGVRKDFPIFLMTAEKS